MELTHLGISVIIDDYNDLSSSTLLMRCADGVERWVYTMLAGWITDQQEMDRICADTSLRCKQCVAPKNQLHDPHTVWERRKGKDVEMAVRKAFAGRFPGEKGLIARLPLFKLGIDPKSKRPRWLPTKDCTLKVYKEARQALGGVHLVENGLWRARHYDYLMQVRAGCDLCLDNV